jgi:cystathionine beta-lyase/cystathionine gamma-synthase
VTRPSAPPVYLTTAFDLEGLEQLDDVVAGQAKGYIYTRDGNPNHEVFAADVARLNKSERRRLRRSILCGRAKPCVWTARMLTALITGVEGGKWFRLFDKVVAERTLRAAYQQVASKKGAAGVDHVTTAEFGQQIPENLWQLTDARACMSRPSFHQSSVEFA